MFVVDKIIGTGRAIAQAVYMGPYGGGDPGSKTYIHFQPLFLSVLLPYLYDGTTL